MITIKNKETICNGKFSSYRITHFLDRNQKERGWEWFSKKDVVVVLPVTKENKIVCIRNFRIPIESNIIELPAGVLEVNVSPEEQIRKELLAETGYKCEKIYKIGQFPLNAGITNNLVTYYVGINAELVDVKQDLEESEDIDVRVLSLQEIVDLLKDKNVVVDAGIFSLVYLAQINGYLKR